jgi:hypothetical protein
MRNQISASLEVASGAFSKELRPDRAPPQGPFEISGSLELDLEVGHMLGQISTSPEPPTP